MRRRNLWQVPALLTALAWPAAAADTLTIDKAHSQVEFRVRHLVSRVSGRFTDFSGTIAGDVIKPETASVAFTVQATSIDTSNAKRDEHLRSPDFFDVTKFPTIEFKSHKVTPAGQDSYAVVGALTMRGVTREVTLAVTFLGWARDPWGGERAGFELKTTLNRKDYGIVWNQTLDTGGLLLGDEVEISISIEAVKSKPAAAQ